jgi:hypothetical protein
MRKQIWKVPLDTAAYKVTEDLKLYSQFCSLQKSSQQVQQQLAVLNMLAAQKQQAIMTLVTLQNIGVRIDETGLSRIFDLGKFGSRGERQ